MIMKITQILKDVFIGIDVHKKTYKICVISNKEILFQTTMRAEPKELEKTLKKYEGCNIHTAYEAGFSGFVLHRFLESKGVKSIVVNPSSIPEKKNDRVKTDRRDARKIATELSNGNLKGIYIPSEEEESRRVLTRARSAMVSERTALKNQVWMKLYQFGYVTGEQRGLSLKYIDAFLKKDELREELKTALECIVSLWKSTNEQILKLNKQIAEQSKKSKEVAILQSIPGVGALSGCILYNELGNMSQFSSEKKLFSYVGLTPSEDSSGEKVRRGHITRQGRPMLRATLVQCAWIAIRDNSGLKSIFTKLAHRVGVKRAIIAIAKKLIAICRALLREGRLFEPKGTPALA